MEYYLTQIENEQIIESLKLSQDEFEQLKKIFEQNRKKEKELWKLGLFP